MINPAQVVIVEIEQYLRGRAPGEVSKIIKQSCLDSGLAESQLSFAASPLSGVKLAMEQMLADDLGLFLVLSEREEVIDYVKEHS